MGPSRTHNLVLTMLLSMAPFAGAQDRNAPGDFHTREDQGRHLYSVSAFAHGHRHGYEAGYRQADLEIHIGRRQRTLPDKNIPKADYRKEFGDRRRFQQGYISGFMAGYKDSHANQDFRLVEWVEDVPPFAWMRDLPQGDHGRTPTPGLRANFDEGMAHGYEAGLKDRAEVADAAAMAARAGKACGAAARPEGYCEGYTQGFLLGANDRGVLSPGRHTGLAQNTAAAK